MDFDKMRESGGSFVAGSGTMNAYRKWAALQVCTHCGAKASERERDEDGKLLEWWITETDCGCTWPAESNRRAL